MYCITLGIGVMLGLALGVIMALVMDYVQLSDNKKRAL